MIIITRAQLAELRDCTEATVSKAGLPHTKDHNKNIYNLSDPVVKAWAMEPYVKQQLNSTKKADTSETEDIELLKVEKLMKDNLIKDEQHRKLKWHNEIVAKNLIPSELVAIYLGYIAAGIRDNFLVIGNRVSKGDIHLRDNIEKEIKKAIEKTIKNAARELRKENKNIAKAMEE